MKMANIIGEITRIESVKNGKISKNEIYIKSKDEFAKIEFRGVMKKASNNLKIGDIISVDYKLKGNESKSGCFFTNVIATNISKL